MWTDQEHMHVQDLRYLNVAMNRISRCENLQGCESLEKLDMTLNKIGIAELPSLSALRANLALRRLYLLGNPCTTWPDHRQYVIATLPQIDHLVSEQVISVMHTAPLIPLKATSVVQHAQDGGDILRSERISAKRHLPQLLEHMQSHQNDTQSPSSLTDDDTGEMPL